MAARRHLTEREQLARDLERVAEAFQPLVERLADRPRWEYAPAPPALWLLSGALRLLDLGGLALAPGFYRAAEVRFGRIDTSARGTIDDLTALLDDCGDDDEGESCG